MTSFGAVPPSSRRTMHDEGCIAAHALDVLGERWSFLVIRELMFGPKRFSRIRAGLPGISASVLVQRLEGLETYGLLTRIHLPEPADVQLYGLTPLGTAVRPVILALCQWGVRLPGHDPTKHISAAALMLSMEAMGDRAGAVLRGGFVCDGEGFEVETGEGGYRVERAARPEAPFVLSGKSNALAAAIYGPRKVTENVASGRVALEGDAAAAQSFVDRFSLRPKPA